MRLPRIAALAGVALSVLAGLISPVLGQGTPLQSLTNLTGAEQVLLAAPCSWTCFVSAANLKAFVGGGSSTNVNSVLLNGAASGSPPSVAPGGTGSDTNIGLILAPKGNLNVCLGGTTLANASLCSPTVASAVNEVVVTGAATTVVPTIAVGGGSADANIGLALNGAGTGAVYFGGTTAANAAASVAHGTTNVNQIVLTGTNTAGTSSVTVGGSGADANAPLAIAGNGTGSVLIGGTTTTLAGLQVAQTASRVNDIVVTPSATTVVPTIAVGGAGADANIGLALNGAGTGSVLLGGTTAANAAMSVAHGTTNVNQVIVTGTNTGTAPSIAVGGSGADANRNLSVAGNGTGLVVLGQTVCTASGATPTCNGQRGVVTTGTLTTAAVTVAVATTITNSSVTTSSIVHCENMGYSGTYSTNGVPVILDCVPTANTITVHILNQHASNALNGTLAIAVTVLN